MINQVLSRDFVQQPGERQSDSKDAFTDTNNRKVIIFDLMKVVNETGVKNQVKNLQRFKESIYGYDKTPITPLSRDNRCHNVENS